MQGMRSAAGDHGPSTWTVSYMMSRVSPAFKTSSRRLVANSAPYDEIKLPQYVTTSSILLTVIIITYFL